MDSTKCKTCENTSGVDDKFTVMALDLDEAKETEKMGENIVWKGKRDSIEDLIVRYHVKEDLNSNKSCKERSFYI